MPNPRGDGSEPNSLWEFRSRRGASLIPLPGIRVHRTPPGFTTPGHPPNCQPNAKPTRGWLSRVPSENQRFSWPLMECLSRRFPSPGFATPHDHSPNNANPTRGWLSLVRRRIANPMIFEPGGSNPPPRACSILKSFKIYQNGTSRGMILGTCEKLEIFHVCAQSLIVQTFEPWSSNYHIYTVVRGVENL